MPSLFNILATVPFFQPISDKWARVHAATLIDDESVDGNDERLLCSMRAECICVHCVYCCVTRSACE